MGQRIDKQLERMFLSSFGRIKMQQSILLYLDANGTWISRHSDPEVSRLFGGSDIPTAFTQWTSGDAVVRRIAQMNPDCSVGLMCGGAK